MTVELKELEEKAREVGRIIGGAVDTSFGKHKVGFALLLFDFGPGGHMTWISSAQRSDMLAALREMITRLESH